MRVKKDWRSGSKENYYNFCKKHPSITLTFDEWNKIIYTFSDYFKEYILETGEKAKLPQGFGDFSIVKKKRKRTKILDGKEYINLPIDWQKTKEKGKKIYNLNFHTEGYFFGWRWFKPSVHISNGALWFFKPSRVTSRLLAHYIKTDNKYQHLYKEWQ